MARLRGLAVWLTAVMTMAAGFPQSACACPGRPDKSAESSTVQACPCGGGCCASAATAKCCDGERGPIKPSSPRESGQTGCKKTIVAQHAQIRPTANNIRSSVDSVTWITVSVNVVRAAQPVIAMAPAWQLPAHAPPTDLLLLLQHFLI